MAKQLALMRAWLIVNRGEMRAILLAVGLGAALLLVYTRHPGASVATNAGFGPDWACTQAPEGGPVCVKKPAAPSRQTE
jgi:hypothetical protein